ncbi:hypothetical protein OROMI_004855 [Orobanche minor]
MLGDSWARASAVFMMPLTSSYSSSSSSLIVNMEISCQKPVARN